MLVEMDAVHRAAALVRDRVLRAGALLKQPFVGVLVALLVCVCRGLAKRGAGPFTIGADTLRSD